MTTSLGASCTASNVSLGEYVTTIPRDRARALLKTTMKRGGEGEGIGKRGYQFSDGDRENKIGKLGGRRRRT